MPSRTGLGELEQLVLLALIRVGEGAYGVSIRDEIRERAGRSISAGTIYPTLDRLERKGYVRSWMGEPTAERGGRAKRHFSICPAGLNAVRQSWQEVASLADGFEGVLDQEG